MTIRVIRTYHRANDGIIKLGTGLDDFGNEIVLPSALFSRTIIPTRNLSLVVLGPSSLDQRANRIEISNPADHE